MSVRYPRECGSKRSATRSTTIDDGGGDGSGDDSLHDNPELPAVRLQHSSTVVCNIQSAVLKEKRHCSRKSAKSCGASGLIFVQHLFCLQSTTDSLNLRILRTSYSGKIHNNNRKENRATAKNRKHHASFNVRVLYPSPVAKRYHKSTASNRTINKTYNTITREK